MLSFSQSAGYINTKHLDEIRYDCIELKFLFKNILFAFSVSFEKGVKLKKNF
jgi:hypothetical protein